METVSLADQLACARHELWMRERTYPEMIARGRQTQAWAEFQLACMAAIVATLETLMNTNPEPGAPDAALS